MYYSNMDEREVRLLRTRLQELHRRQRRETPPIEGIGGTSARVLGAIARAEGGAGPGAIAAELAMTSSNVAAALRELDAAGLVVRVADPEDRRRVRLLLSRAGEAAVAAHRHGRDEWFAAAIEAELDPAEQELLMRVSPLIERLARWSGGR